MPTKGLYAVLVLLLVLAGPLAAQERQVPLDETGQVDVVDLPLARRLGLWVDEYPDFHQARLFRAPDGGYVLVIATLNSGELEQYRLPLPPGEAAALRRDVAARLAALSAARRGGEMDQRGRYLLLGQTTAAGLFFYGWALPYALDLDGGAAAGTYLLTAAGSFFLPFALTQDRPVSYGMANLSRYGVTRGVAHGVLLHDLLRGEEDRFDCVGPSAPCHDTGDSDLDRSRMAAALLASVAEGVGGYLWARNEEMSAGTASAIALGGDAGLLWGVGAAHLAGVDDGPDRARAVIALPGAVVGVIGAHRLAARRDYVWGDVDVMYTGGVVGAYTGAATMELVGAGDSKAFTAASMLGGAAGLYLADRLVRDTDFTVGQATLNRLGTLAGGLAGASVGVMANEETVAVVGSALGALAGFAGTYAALAPRAREQRGDALSSLRVRLAPDVTGGGVRPMLSLEYRFGGPAAGSGGGE